MVIAYWTEVTNLFHNRSLVKEVALKKLLNKLYTHTQIHTYK